MARCLASDMTDSVLFPWIRCLQGVDFFVFNNDATKIQEVQGEEAPCPLPLWCCKPLAAAGMPCSSCQPHPTSLQTPL